MRGAENTSHVPEGRLLVGALRLTSCRARVAAISTLKLCLRIFGQLTTHSSVLLRGRTSTCCASILPRVLALKGLIILS